MMRIADETFMARGFVSPSFVDVATGRRIPFAVRHNQLSYFSAEAMAAAFGGDASYIPSRVGFIFGGQADVPSSSWNADGESSGGKFGEEIGRSQSWTDLVDSLSDTMDVLVVPFSYSPSLGTYDDGASDVSASSGGVDAYGCVSRAVTFHAVSNSSDKGAVHGHVFKDTHVILQAVLLGGAPHGSFNAYGIVSRVSLKMDDGYRTKPVHFEVALDWTVVFS